MKNTKSSTKTTRKQNPKAKKEKAKKEVTPAMFAQRWNEAIGYNMFGG